MPHDSIVILSAARTPTANFQGNFKDLTATELGSIAIKAAVERAHVNPTDISSSSEVLMGCVLPAGLGQAPARQAALGAGLPTSIPCTTLNKMCGSGMSAIMVAHDKLLAGSIQLAIAGGMESMTNAPYLLPKARAGYRMGHQRAMDHMFLDGLEDAYDKGRLMGAFAEDCAQALGFTRVMQDDFAIESIKKAQNSSEKNYFLAEIVPVQLTTKAGEMIIEKDEGPLTAKIEKIPQLKPAFSPTGTVTAANSSSISDGAAAVVLMREQDAQKQHLTPLAKIIGHSTHAQTPAEFTTAPIGAIQKLLDNIGWHKDDVDLFEINEAFAVVTMAAIHALKLAPEKVNVNGGACVLGHPIGASGARIVVTLIHALRQRKLRRGIASLCIGGGEATAIAIELS